MVTRIGNWLPNDPRVLRKWLKKRVNHVQKNPPKWSSVVEDFYNTVINDAELYMLFKEMLREVPAKYGDDPAGHPEIRDIETLFNVFQSILSEPPDWDSSAQIGTPINAVLDWPMGTKAGFAAFLKSNVNEHFKNMLTSWGNFLTTEASTSTLNNQPGGWFSQVALNSPHLRSLVDDFGVDVTKPAGGFCSWDAFFTREFLPGRRPIGSPDDDSIIVSAAEATPFAVQCQVQLHDDFWIKGQKYSLAHMMNNDHRASKFVNGTVYQAFLSADSYHRFHAPVSGRIVDLPAIVAGTYYSEPLATGFSPDSGKPDPDPGADEASQGYISAVATRGVMFIQADNPKIGLVCMIVVGMAEVSSVEITMAPNTPFQKGAPLGMFHFGGSTHCLCFLPGVDLAFNFPDDLPGPNNNIQWPVNQALATVKSTANAVY
ncbi:phosphatidylserine decarboxylase family protein [Colletotrichum zoysiae]|uniref:Phosphatidylserine decarboxylase family protein n=1 Tax=Colletotrichum zoysiae TaxID=1216348 RepID=A0AAD9HH06_9PEZI|nr:phosphatidylserine decarboxylase family protein [Colletotrichum zoysiae]